MRDGRKISNATIESTMLGIEDHGVMIFYVHCAGEGWGQGFGGYILDGPEEPGNYDNHRRTANGFGIVAIRIVALHAIACAAESVGESGWENYPDIGERDWESVVDLIAEIATFPRAEEYREAYDLLEDRADPTPNGNAQNAQSKVQAGGSE